MAEKWEDDLDDVSDNLEEKIRQLEKEKKRLEKQNLQKKFKELSRTVTSLKSSTGSTEYDDMPRVSSQTPGSSPMRDKNLSQRDKSESSSVDSGIVGMLNESRARLKALQRRSGEGSPGRHAASDDDSDEEFDRGNLDKVMSKEHKQKLQINRDTLVESMIPDDIFNDLIANKVLTTADVGRIKEKNTRESMNEELLNNLIRRSDRAFYEFVRSLRKTLQGYLADMLDEQVHQTKMRSKRKRQAGELNISVDCEDISPAPKKPMCSCAEVEHEILVMAKTAYKAIRRRDNTPASFEQFKKELSQTNEIVKESMEIMHTLKILCNHGDLDIYHGSIIFTIRCNSVKCVNDLWQLHVSGELQRLIQDKFVTRRLLMRCKASAIRLRVCIVEREYRKCLLELKRKERLGKIKNKSNLANRILRSSVIQPASENHPSKGKPCRVMTGNRRAFREMFQCIKLPWEKKNQSPLSMLDRDLLTLVSSTSSTTRQDSLWRTNYFTLRPRNTSFTELRTSPKLSYKVMKGASSDNLYSNRLRSHSYIPLSNSMPVS